MHKLKVIIAGGRDYHFILEDIQFLNNLHNELKFTAIISGGARGADTEGEIWAKENNIPIERYPAQWNHFGRSAGFIRNKLMAKEGDMLIAFPGSKGTAHMVRIMQEANKNVVEVYEKLGA